VKKLIFTDISPSQATLPHIHRNKPYDVSTSYYDYFTS